MKKLFALVAVAGLLFAIGCAPETKKTVIEKKPDGGTTVEAEVKPGETADIKVDDKGADVEVKPETPVEPPKEEPKAEDAPKEEPKAEDAPKEEPKAEDVPKEEPKAEDAPKEEPKAEDK